MPDVTGADHRAAAGARSAARLDRADAALVRQHAAGQRPLPGARARGGSAGSSGGAWSTSGSRCGRRWSGRSPRSCLAVAVSAGLPLRLSAVGDGDPAPAEPAAAHRAARRSTGSTRRCSTTRSSMAPCSRPGCCSASTASAGPARTSTWAPALSPGQAAAARRRPRSACICWPWRPGHGGGALDRVLAPPTARSAARTAAPRMSP